MEHPTHIVVETPNSRFSNVQLIFRKVADVRREKELAERRKHEPQLDQNQDQLVRKIFSKFRRDRAAQGQTTPASTETTADVEKGVTGATSTEVVPKTPTVKSSGHSERGELSCPVLVTKPKPAGSRSGKWGRLLGSSSVESGSESTSTKYLPGASKEPSALRLPTSGTNGSGNKVFPKLQKVTATSAGPLHSPSGLRREKTIDESIEVEETSAPKPESGLVVYQPKGTSPDKYKEIITNIMDFKVDVKLEVQRLNQKIARMEELLGEIVNRLPASQPLVISQSSQESEADRPLKPILRTNSFGSIIASTSRELHPPVVSLAPRKRRSKSRSKAVAPSAPSQESEADRPLKPILRTNSFGSIIASTSRELHPPVVSLAPRKRRSKSRSKAVAPSAPPKTPPPPEPETSEASQPVADPSDETKRPFYVKPKDIS
ncbi:potassium voltage-gated channel protein eag-like [Diaphorina citri]|uniref:Potassium voltage-gated channel protein eag-like n=1 Tax=Diaphorina citri TaxID=121845 RepID=A0A3Q0J5F8_DIACI|nr:potassium voltage-gated channel protein eag-like [Diaphorina citri]